jgi:hypothetical protein
LYLNRKLAYGEIIRKIGFQAFNFAADDRRHRRRMVRVILKDLFRGTLRFAPLKATKGCDSPEQQTRVWIGALTR